MLINGGDAGTLQLKRLNTPQPHSILDFLTLNSGLLHISLTHFGPPELKMSQISKSPSYLIRNTHSYCFRMNVPADLRPLIGKRELRFSLQTGYLRTAKSRARVIAGRVQLLFQEMRRNHKTFMKLSDQQIQDIVTRYLQ
jgi:hypothetical protein